MSQNNWSKIIISASIFFATFTTHAETSSNSGFDATFGGSIEYGQLKGDEAHGHKARSMTAWSFEALPGYRLNSKWLFGLDLNYRIQQQLTGIDDAGGTNLKGKGWLLGLGSQYRLNTQWAIQGAIDFLGNYKFDKQTASNQTDHLEEPLSIHLKGQYFFLKQWTADINANYIHWSKFKVSGSNHDESASQWMIGAGITYHFDDFGSLRNNSGHNTVAKSEAEKTTTQSESQRKKVAMIFDAEKTSTGYKVNLPSAAFASGKADLSPSFKAKIKEVGENLAKNPNQRITIKGHTDSSGNTSFNNKLSQMRANNVRAALLEGGVRQEGVEAVGVGSQEPIADNSTPDGRTQNRRVEIFVQQTDN